MKSSHVAALTLVLMTVVIGCGDKAAPLPERVESPHLGIALASLPAPFRVEHNAGESLDLAAPGDNGAAELTIGVGPLESGGINLVDQVKRRKEAFHELPDGRYFGNRELGTPIGTAFTARGAYTGESGPVEETWVFAIHPGANRLLTMTYRYPAADDSAVRVEQLISVLGEIEGLGTGSGA